MSSDDKPTPVRVCGEAQVLVSPCFTRSLNGMIMDDPPAILGVFDFHSHVAKLLFAHNNVQNRHSSTEIDTATNLGGMKIIGTKTTGCCVVARTLEFV